jgi:hypothetical protein
VQPYPVRLCVFHTLASMLTFSPFAAVLPSGSLSLSTSPPSASYHISTLEWESSVRSILPMHVPLLPASRHPCHSPHHTLPSVALNGIEPAYSPSLTMLGTILDGQLTFKAYITACAAKAMVALTGVGLLARARDGLAPKWVKRMVEGVVMLWLLWMGGVWWDERVVSKELDSVQRAAARLVTGGYRTTSLASKSKPASRLSSSAFDASSTASSYVSTPLHFPALSTTVSSSPKRPQPAPIFRRSISPRTPSRPSYHPPPSSRPSTLPPYRPGTRPQLSPSRSPPPNKKGW